MGIEPTICRVYSFSLVSLVLLVACTFAPRIASVINHFFLFYIKESVDIMVCLTVRAIVVDTHSWYILS